RRAWPKLKAEQRRALEVVERYADGKAKYGEMRFAVQGMRIAGYRSQPLLVEAARRDAWSGLAGGIGELLRILRSGAPDDLERGGKAHTDSTGQRRMNGRGNAPCFATSCATASPMSLSRSRSGLRGGPRRCWTLPRPLTNSANCLRGSLRRRASPSSGMPWRM